MNRKQTALVVFILLIAAVFAGCKQQQQSQWGQGQAGRTRCARRPWSRARRRSNSSRQSRKRMPECERLDRPGNAQMDAQRFAEAVISYQRHWTSTEERDVRVDMGTCYRGLGQPQKAIEEYQKASKIDPSIPWPR